MILNYLKIYQLIYLKEIEMRNYIKKLNSENKIAKGCTLVYPSPDVVEMLGMAGYDYIRLDGEHGAFSPESIDDMVRVADSVGLYVLARVPSIEPHVINNYLDRGIKGIMGPHIENAENAQQLVDSCRFYPNGKRSWGGGRGNFYHNITILDKKFGGKSKFVDIASDSIFIEAQIETQASINNLKEILSVDGIDAFTFGPNDLAQSIKLPGQPEHKDVQKLMNHATQTIEESGKFMSSKFLTSITLADLIIDGSKNYLKE